MSKLFDAAKKYFSLRTDDVAEGYDFAVAAKPLKGATIGQSIKIYFDLYANHRAGDRLANEIMALANSEGVAKGRFDNSTATVGYDFSFRENNFELRKDCDRVLLKCDAAFAEKVGKLTSAGAVTTLKKPAAPKQEAPKP